MVAFQNIVISSILAVAAMAAPTVLDKDTSSSTLVRRKNTNKCEAHIHIDASNGLCGNSCTTKYNIDLLNNAVPAQAFGKTFDWSRVGTWSATNPNYQIKIGTTRGLELWIDGRIPSGLVHDSWRSSFTLHYGPVMDTAMNLTSGVSLTARRLGEVERLVHTFERTAVPGLGGDTDNYA
ncbi:hypothetical protein D6D13_09768 [Aureobasidium pullulans]|uniref:Concanavalin A-like lectin/glucanase n=1 Tax=Aureobasidium pullulans TaxID=5580 RepID=A0A4S9C0R8_AURPU|nr:hypothetical protein D6D13_09768 [Aureobasidium pullulans]